MKFLSVMVNALGRRVLQATLVAFIVSTLCFVMTRMLPGDMAYRIAAGRYGYDMVSSAAADAVHRELGLDLPLLQALWHWWRQLFQFDLGTSYVTARTVSSEIITQLGPTLQLSLLAIFLSCVIGPAIGIWAGLRPNGIIDRTSLCLSVLLRAMPTFVLGLLLIMVFSVQMGALPAAGPHMHGSILLPALTLALGLAAVSSRVTRDVMVSVSTSAYFTFARTKGLSLSQTLVHHGLRNIAAPVIAYLGIQLVFLIEGVVLVETIFAWPGIGHALVHAIFSRDIPMIQGTALMLGMMFVLFNTCIDLLCTIIDPRRRQ
jgi:peptide/nickel transport system permease protein